MITQIFFMVRNGCGATFSIRACQLHKPGKAELHFRCLEPIEKTVYKTKITDEVAQSILKVHGESGEGEYARLCAIVRPYLDEVEKQIKDAS